MYYDYELKYPASNITFYVGKGKGRRASYHTMRNKKGCWTDNRYKDNVIRQILNTGADPLIEYVFYTEEENIAYNFEEMLIKKYGRRLFDEKGILTNICESSRPPHSVYSTERKEKYRKRMIGNTLALGRIQTTEEKAQRGNTLAESYKTGKRQVTDKMREASRIAHTGKIVSEETRKKQSIIAKNRPPLSKESIEKSKKTKIERGVLPPNRKKITIDGITYNSIREAAVSLVITEYKAKNLSDEYSKKI